MATLVLGAAGAAIGGSIGGAILGVSAATIGGFIGSLIGIGATLTEFSVPGLLMSLLGAIVLLGIANMVQRGRVR